MKSVMLLVGAVLCMGSAGCGPLDGEANAKPVRYDGELAVFLAAMDDQHSPIPNDKVPRSECKTCDGKGWYMSGDGIQKIECQDCYEEQQPEENGDNPFEIEEEPQPLSRYLMPRAIELNRVAFDPWIDTPEKKKAQEPVAEAQPPADTEPVTEPVATQPPPVVVDPIPDETIDLLVNEIVSKVVENVKEMIKKEVADQIALAFATYDTDKTVPCEDGLCPIQPADNCTCDNCECADPSLCDSGSCGVSRGSSCSSGSCSSGSRGSGSYSSGSCSSGSCSSGSGALGYGGWGEYRGRPLRRVAKAAVTPFRAVGRFFRNGGFFRRGCR